MSGVPKKPNGRIKTPRRPRRLRQRSQKAEEMRIAAEENGWAVAGEKSASPVVAPRSMIDEAPAAAATKRAV